MQLANGLTVALLVMASAPGTAWADNLLLVADATGTQGDVGVTFDIHLENSDVVAGMQYDLIFDPEVLTIVDSTTTPRADGLVYQSSFPKKTTGVHRVLMFGFGQNLDPGDGAIIQYTVDVDLCADIGSSALTLEDVIFSDTLGKEMKSRTENGSFLVELSTDTGVDCGTDTADTGLDTDITNDTDADTDVADTDDTSVLDTAPPSEPDSDGDDKDGSSGCGCQTSGSVTWGWLGLLTLMTVVSRRKEASTSVS